MARSLPAKRSAGLAALVRKLNSAVAQHCNFPGSLGYSEATRQAPPDVGSEKPASPPDSVTEGSHSPV